jgi:PKD repeat protein
MVSLTATANNATDYVWNFGDNTVESGSDNTQHAYAAAGVYNVTVTANNNTCADIAVKTINVTNTATDINNAYAKTLNAYCSGNYVVVEFNNWGAGKANLTVYNMLGQELNSITGVSTINGRQEIQLTDIKPGYYLLKVTTQDKQLYKKLYLSE